MDARFTRLKVVKLNTIKNTTYKIINISLCTHSLFEIAFVVLVSFPLVTYLRIHSAP